VSALVVHVRSLWPVFVWPLTSSASTCRGFVAKRRNRRWRLQLCPKISAIVLGNLNRFRKKISKSCFHRLIGLHSQILALLLPFFIFRDDVAHGCELKHRTRSNNDGQGGEFPSGRRYRPPPPTPRTGTRGARRSVQQEMALGHADRHCGARPGARA
jgi:hypothetical protein